MSSQVTPDSDTKSSWLRRYRLWLGASGALVLLYVLFGFFVVPRIIRSQLESGARETLHRAVRVDDVRFNPFTLAATISGLHLADRDGAELLGFGRLYVNFELSGVFRRAWRFKEIRVEQPVIAARIMADGRSSVADLLEDRGPDAEPFSLPRIIIERLLVSDGVATFADASKQPTYQSRFAPLALDVSDLITIPEEGGKHALTIGIGERTRLRWTGRQVVEPLRFTGQLDITGLELHQLWDYFASDHRLDLRDGRVDLALPYEVRRTAAEGFGVTLTGASARFTGVAVRPRDGGQDWASLPDARVDDVQVSWPAARADVAKVTITRPQLLVRQESDGAFNWQQAFPASQQEPSSKPWTYRVGSVEVVEGAVGLESASDPDVGRLDLTALSLRASDISSDLTSPITFSANAKLPADGAIEAAGTVAPSPLAFEVTYGARGLGLTHLQPYMARVSGVRIGAGTVALKGKASLGPSRPLLVSADGSVDGVEVLDPDGERLGAWRSLAIDGFTLEDPPNRVRVRKLIFDQAFARVLIGKDGRLILTRLGASSPPAGTTNKVQPAVSAVSSPGRRAPTVEVGIIELRNASAEFHDRSLPLEFRAQIHSANGSIRDLSTFAAAPATVDVEGRVDKTGFVKVGGTLRTSDPLAASEIGVEFRSIEMLGLTPYFAEFAGYAVRSGVLDLDVQYRIQSRRLVGTHTLVARDLVLGERIKDSKVPDFALRLAVALLKDREGRINLDVPIQGDVDSPQFAYRQVFWGAVRTILGNAAKAPFRALGRMFGRDEDDLELVEFDPGRSELLPADREVLTRLAEQLTQRQDLSMTVQGRFDAKADPPPMKRTKLEQLIDSRRGAAAASAAAGTSALETILETLFVERFSAEALQAERVRATRPVTGPGSPAAAAGNAAPPTTSAPGAASATASSFDGAAFYESLRARLLETQTVTQDELTALANARAAAIVAALNQSGALGSRVTATSPAEAKRSKTGSSRIASEMTMSAGGTGERD